MITTVSLNPAIDKTILITDFTRGGVNRLTNVREDIGGKGINVAKILNRLNVPTAVCGFVGSHNRQIVDKLLSCENLIYHFLETEGVTRTNTKIVELDHKLTTDLNEQGFILTDDQLEAFQTMLLDNARKSDFVVFSGSIPKGLPNTTYRHLISIINPFAKTILDADGDLLVEGIKASPYMIKPNIHELESAFSLSLKTDDDVIQFCGTLAKKYNIKLILVSMGENGSLLITQDNCYRAQPITVDVKSTVGAGDSMIAGMLYGIYKGLPLSEAFAYAIACGTLAVTKEGTMTLSEDEIHEMLQKVNIITLTQN